MRISTLVTAILVSLLAAPPALADTILVPQDQPTIQAAVDAAMQGDTIELKRGKYTETVVIDGVNDLTIRGFGKATIDAQTNGTCIMVLNSNGITITGLKLQKASEDGVFVNASNNVEISDCKIQKCGDDAVQADASDNVRVLRCNIKKIGNDGVSFSVDGGTRTTTNDSMVADCKIVNCGDDAVDLNGDNNMVKNNKIIKTLEDGLEVCSSGDATGNVFMGNSLKKLTCRGIVLTRRGNTAMGNKVVAAKDDAIVAIGSGHTISENEVAKSGFDGVYCPADNCTINDNEVKKPKDDGYDIEGTGNDVRDNSVSKAKNNGYEIDGGNNTFTNNTASKSKGLDADDSTGGGTNTYNGNTFPKNNLP